MFIKGQSFSLPICNDVSEVGGLGVELGGRLVMGAVVVATC